MLALAINLVSGSYSGFVHAHDHDHSATDHHRDDHIADYADDGDDLSVLAAMHLTKRPTGRSTIDQSHEHNAELVLNFVYASSTQIGSEQPPWFPLKPAAEIAHALDPFERPPRVVT